MVYGFGLIWRKLGYAKSVVGLRWFGRHRNGHTWIIVPHCLMWCLWMEKNRCFEDNERSISDLKLFFFKNLVDWLLALQNQSFSSFLEFLDLFNFCT